MSRSIRFHWHPASGARHAFPADAEHEEKIQAICGEVVSPAELHERTEVAWITEPTCIRCWDQLLPDDPAHAPVH